MTISLNNDSPPILEYCWKKSTPLLTINPRTLQFIASAERKPGQKTVFSTVAEFSWNTIS